MKQIFIILITILICSPCKSQKLRLQLNLLEGETYYQNISSDVRIFQTFNDEKINNITSITGKMSFKVLELNDSCYKLEVCYKNISMKIGNNTSITEYNSETKDSSDIFSSILSSMLNKPFTAYLSKTGKILKILNIDTIYSGIYQIFPNLSESKKQLIKAKIEESYGEKIFIGSLESTLAFFPDKLIRKNQKWTVLTKLQSNLNLNITTKYKILEYSDKYCTIIGKSKLESIKNQDFTELNDLMLKFEVTGTMESKIKIDSNTGWIIEAKINQQITGNTLINKSTTFPEGVTVPTEMLIENIVTN